MPKFVDDFALHTMLFLRSHTDAVSGALAETLSQMAATFESKLAEIESNQNLSSVGKSQQMHAARLALGEALERLKAEVITDQLDKSIRATEKALEPIPDEKKDPLELLRLEIRNAEIRRSLADVDPLILQTSLADYPPEIRAALESSPPRVVRKDRGRDKGEIVFVDLAPEPIAPTSPELEGLVSQKAAIEGLLSQLGHDADVPRALAEQAAMDQAADVVTNNNNARAVD